MAYEPQTPSLLYPDTSVLFDDNFTNGFCGWEELVNPTGAFSQAMNTPLSLSSRGGLGGYSLLLQTNSVERTTYGSQAIAIKRVIQPYIPGSVGKVAAEWWFSYGSENVTESSGFPGAPATITFEVDSQTDASSTTSIVTGQRAYFQAQWQPQSGGSWGFTTSNGPAYGQGGYVSPDSNLFTSGYKSIFPYNGNKRNINYVCLTVNVRTGAYVSLIANNQFFDLTACPNGTLAGPISPTDPSYNVSDINGLLNSIVNVNNRSTTATTASFVEIHRARMSLT